MYLHLSATKVYSIIIHSLKTKKYLNVIFRFQIRVYKPLSLFSPLFSYQNNTIWQESFQNLSIYPNILLQKSTYKFPCLILIFKAPEPPLNHDVICPATLTVQPLSHMKSIYCHLWTDWSELMIESFATLKAFPQALIIIILFRVSSISQPTMQRLYQSIMAVR